MTLKSGTQLRSYEIISAIGKGGMGEVYQAKDLKLGREVAIKVLPEEFAKNADRVARFQREAKLLASLNHPNIAAIYGLEESDGTNFLVLELVEGETLADQLARGPIAVEESLKLGLQIAEALEAAHEKGVVHRDLKPANIKVTPDGKVKVLDFGLAKAFAGEQAEMNLSASPTLSHLATQQGIILGTAAYMSPEQAKGKPVDKRTDIWAFGCVLYEMLTSQAAFQGEDVTEILAAVVKGGANLDLLPLSLHSKVRETITRCLQKDLRKRYQDIGDVRIELEQFPAQPAIAESAAGTPIQSNWRMMLPWVAVAIVLTAIIAGLAVWNLKPGEPRKITRFCFELPKEQQLGDVFERTIAVSPDGGQFVYCTNAGLYLRSLDDLDAKLLAGTGGTRQRPFFSPDGKWIGFFSSTDKKLKKISISGGTPRSLADVSVSGSFEWEADDTIVYGQSGIGIMRVSADGGTPEPIAKAAANELILHPQMLPDGNSVLITRALPSPPRIFVHSLKTGDRKELFEGNLGRYLPTGHIVYEKGRSLFAVRFDVHALKIVGGPVPLLDGVVQTSGAAQYAVCDSGTMIYMPGTVGAGSGEIGRTLVWVDRKGNEEPLAAPPRQYNGARISPDGTKIALTFLKDGNRDIWIWDQLRKTMDRLTSDPAPDVCPLWTPDGRQVVFASERNEGMQIYRKSADGTGKDELLGSVPGLNAFPGTWFHDGKALIVEEGRIEGIANIGVLSMDSSHKHNELLKDQKYFCVQPQISPNGNWMAYTSGESGQGQPEIYVRPFPAVDTGRYKVSTGGGDSPLWSQDGREIYYHSGDAIMAVPVRTVPTFSLETPRVLFRGFYGFPQATLLGQMNVLSMKSWDITPDGKRFLMIREAGAGAPEGIGPRKIIVVMNWMEELKQQVPAGNK
jgi:serine/threonine protein kinase